MQLVIAALIVVASLGVLLIVVFLRVRTLARGAGDGNELRLRLDALATQNERLERDLRADLAQARSENAQAASTARGELSANLTNFTQALQNQLATNAGVQNERLATLTRSNEQSLEAVRTSVEQRLEALRTDNAQKLELMRATVDERLQATLEQRLGESFKLVSDRLDQVHKGLGEMHTLAAGVGDLKRVLVNVKSRGGWGEVQLGALLDEMLAPGQYARNVATRPGEDSRVEYAIRFPGRGEDGMPCWLPIDAKFPLEDYQRLQEAIERADIAAVETSRKCLEDFFKTEARKIRDKYIEPPHTTDFAILFIPTEGLYAEALSRPGLADCLQRDFRVMLAGPTNLMAFLNSLQLGFRTLAIEQRSTEVWRVLGAVKTEFGKFGELLAKTKERLDQVGKTLDEAGRKSTTIAKKLRDVEALPQIEAERVLSGEAEAAEDSELEPDLLTRLDGDGSSSR
ncbi:MAG TPA: DNA recombination protein RmuC [Casimicrobiaceae bacterium]|nr:DNA recombination protein RmuC [Casimicrobiaceae bacterium]